MPEPMYLPQVENNPDISGGFALAIETARRTGAPLPQIWHMFAFKPEATKHLEQFTHAMLRGPSPLSPGFRELIAAFTSVQNQCPF
jgi:hypothetical protein